MSSGIPQKDASIRANRQILIQKVDHDQNEYVTLGKYESPPKIPQEISSVKVQMVNLGKIIGIDDEANDINLDNGHSFCREILFHFSRLHTKQTLESSYIGYDSPNEDNYTLQNYEHLSNLAKKERPNYKVKTRMMEGPIFPSRLYSGDKYSDFLMWKPEIDENAEEIWATIASVAESKLDSLLQNESKWLEINDLEKLEEILDQSIDLYKHLTETPKNTSSSSSLSKQNLTQNIDLTPLDFIANTPPAKTAQDQEKVQENEQIDEKEVELAKRKTDWKHVIKAYLMERLLLQREYKRKIGYAVNYFKSVQRKLTQDSIELGSRHTNSDENIEIKTNNLAAQAQQLKKKQQQLNTLTTAENPASIFHDGSGQPLVYNTENIKTICSKQDDLNEENARKKAWPLLRLHRISQDEIRLIDHNGVYIFLESAIPELEKIMSRLLNCGNYYISQYEGRYGLFGKLKKPVIDRGTVWLDLLKEECGFQYAKLEVIEKLSYIYEHTNDFESMQAVGQLLHNFIDKKPRLQLASEYFIGGYKMEIECMNEYSKLLEKLINMQSLSDSKLSKENTEMINRKKEMYDLEKQKAKINILNNMSGNTNSQIHKTSTNLPNNDKQLYKDPYIGYGGESYRKKLEEILELEPMREQDLFLNHRKMLKSEPQDDELENMFEFISFKEGFDYLIPETSAASKIAYLDESDLPKFGINEFYTSLPEISRILIAIRQGLRSMVEYYQPESGFAISAMEKELIRRASAEYENLQNYALAPPSTIKAEAHSIEANSLCDNPELLIFNLKELYREFNKQNLYDVDPVFIARQSVSTLKEVNFAYFNDPTKILIKPNAENLKWPNLVHFLCNLVEFIRLREFLIDSLFESDKLTEIYKNQQNFVSNSSTILSTADPIIPSKSNKNAWVYPTICNDCKLNFAIKEFDPDLQSILCLHMHKAIKLAVFESGLEEIRAALHYQLMQQQLLQISTLTNFWMYLPYAKAFAELDAVVGGSAISLKQSKRHPFTILNGILGLRIGEDSKVYIREREKIRDKLMRTTAGSFVDLYKAKYLCRGYAQNAWNNFNNKLQPSDTVSKSHDKSIVSQSLEYNSTSIARAQKTFSIYLVHQYCDRVLKMFYTLSIHAHLFAISSSLRFLFRMFPEDELLFDCTKSFGLENVPFSCGLSLGLDEFSLRDGVSTKANFSLNDTLLKIPSTEEIASLIRQFQKEPPVSVQQISYDMNETKPESMIREYLLIGGFQTTKKPKKFLRNDTEPYLYQYDTNSFDLVNGLMLIRNVLTLELGIESTHIPFRLWLQMIKNLKANTLVWRNVQKKGILDNNDNKMNKIEAITREIIEDEHRLSPLEHMLRSVSHRLKVMDCALYKTCGFKVDGVIQYFIIYFKYKYTCVIEAFHKLIDDLPANNIKDKFFDQILSALNYLANMNIGNPTFVSLDNRCFSFTKLQKFDQGLTSYNPNYSSKYGKHIVKERFEDPEIISKIMQDLTNNWHNTKITSLCGIGDLPLQFLFSHLYSIFTNDDIRKSFLSYIGLIEGKAQVEYGPTGTSGEEETEFFILPVEVPKLEELKEQMSAVKEKLRLRKLRIAVMSWLPQKPAISSLEELRVQRKTFLDNTFITMMRIKEEIQFEAEKFDLPRNQRIRMEVLSEIKFLKKWLEKDFIGKGIECIKSEQAIISDLLDKSAGLMEHNMDQLRGTAATIYSNVDPDQRKCITNTLSYIQTFVSQVKNRATIAESLTTGTALIITLHDFNNSLYTLCKNVWRQQVAATKAKIWAERKVQNELHTQTYAEQEKSDRLESDMKKLKTNMEHSIAVEVGQRCYEQIYEVERRIRQCEYWKDRIMLIDKRLRKELKEEARQEIAEKELQLKNYETQFSDYKATLMAQLKAEIAANNNNLAKKYPGYTQSGSPFSKRNSVSKSPGHAGEYISSEHEKSAIENEAEAYDQLAKLQDKVHKLRVFYNMRLALQKEKYKERLCLIKKQITSNSTLYNQLSLAERREVILKQELVNAQRNMAAFEKALRQMQSSLKEKNETLMRFHQIKAAKSSRMVELEAKLKKLSAVEEIDVNALQTELWKKEKEIEELRNLASNKKEHVDTMKTSYQTQMKWMQRKIKKEESEKSEAMQKVEELQLLIAQTKANEPQSAVKKEEGGSLWREKCKELVELCKALKNENEMFRLMVSTNTNLNPGNNNLANSSSNMTVNKTMYSIDEDIPVKDIVPRRNLVNPYAEETKSINYRTNGFENMMVVTGSNNNIYMTGVKPPTRPSVNTRSSSHTGISNRVLMKSTEKPPTAGGPNVPLRPQTQHHPFFNGRKKTRLNSGYSGGRKIMNMSLYPS